MNCCSSNDELSDDTLDTLEPIDDPARVCQSCGIAGRIVPRKTMVLMLKSRCLDLVDNTQYRFCFNPNCTVVYFAEADRSVFTTNDLRVRVGVKETQGNIPICYCFGFDESDLRKEFAKHGQTTIPGRIAKLIRQGLCACLERNPSGVCCLGEINKAINRLSSGA
jgi:hypothetical protein